MTEPALSVVVPVYNDPAGVRETLRSLTEQRCSTDRYEVLVVDNNSTDSTTDVIAEFEDRYPNVVVGLSETDVQSSYAARNTGIEHARADVIAFVDADMTVDPTWVDAVCGVFERSSVDYLGYEVELYAPDGERTFWAQYDLATGLPVEHYLRTKQFAPTCALAVRATVFDAVGLFDESLVSGGDKEFGRRVDDAGFEMGFEASITVRHPARTTFREHVKKARRIGRGQMQLWERHRLAAHPLSPTRVLPPSPWRIRSRTRSLDGFLSVYLAAYLLKLIQSWYLCFHRMRRVRHSSR